MLAANDFGIDGSSALVLRCKRAFILALADVMTPKKSPEDVRPGRMVRAK
jgi:hypothetical protein